jgi:hypothetical protein
VPGTPLIRFGWTALRADQRAFIKGHVKAEFWDKAPDASTAASDTGVDLKVMVALLSSPPATLAQGAPFSHREYVYRTGFHRQLGVIADRSSAPTLVVAPVMPPPSLGRWVDIYIWRSVGTSVGHVMVTEHGSKKVILSQFPHSPSVVSTTSHGPNTTFTYFETIRAENRDPSIRYSILVPDSVGFDKQVAVERDKKYWDWCTNEAETQCSIAAINALQAGGFPYFDGGPRVRIKGTGFPT